MNFDILIKEKCFLTRQEHIKKFRKEPKMQFSWEMEANAHRNSTNLLFPDLAPWISIIQTELCFVLAS